jgi:hypothetical protein
MGLNPKENALESSMKKRFLAPFPCVFHTSSQDQFRLISSISYRDPEWRYGDRIPIPPNEAIRHHGENVQSLPPWQLSQEIK